MPGASESWRLWKRTICRTEQHASSIRRYERALPVFDQDLLLGLDEDGFHRIVWSDDLLAEWERVIVREDQRTADSASSIVATI